MKAGIIAGRILANSSSKLNASPLLCTEESLWIRVSNRSMLRGRERSAIDFFQFQSIHLINYENFNIHHIYFSEFLHKQ
jgi:hypothetical protein